MPAQRWATGPGRVNLIGDHTDYNLGLALPLAVDLGVTVAWEPGGDGFTVVSDAYPGEVARIPRRPETATLTRLEPVWARLVAAVVSLARPATGGVLRVSSTLPAGAGLSSSAAVGVALCALFGAGGTPEEVARLCQEAEHRTGVPVGLLDPLVCAGGRRGHALLVDFASLATEHVPVPEGAEVVVVDSGTRRDLRNAPYADRVAECAAAAARVGRPLGLAGEDDLAGLADPRLRRRARHVVTECRRVRGAAAALARGDLAVAGALLDESHASLATDFEVSTPELDALVADLRARPGTFGARLTGAGFGGCVVVLAEPGALDPAGLDRPAWRVRAADGALGPTGG